MNSKDNSNIVFVLEPQKVFDNMPQVYANKSLVLFRLFEREMRSMANDKASYCLKIGDILNSKILREKLPAFLVRVFDAKDGERIFLRGVKNKDEFIKFLEFAYCDKLIEPVTSAQIKILKNISETLGLMSVACYFERLHCSIRNKLVEDLIKDLHGKIQQQP